MGTGVLLMLLVKGHSTEGVNALKKGGKLGKNRIDALQPVTKQKTN